MSDEIRDLRDRLHRAKNDLFKLEEIAEERDDWFEVERLAGKREGVCLALGYTEDYMR